MSIGSDKRNHAMAIRAAKLRREGHTTRQIADLINKKPEQIRAIILLGERLLADGGTAQ